MLITAEPPDTAPSWERRQNTAKNLLSLGKKEAKKKCGLGKRDPTIPKPQQAKPPDTCALGTPPPSPMRRQNHDDDNDDAKRKNGDKNKIQKPYLQKNRKNKNPEERTSTKDKPKRNPHKNRKQPNTITNQYTSTTPKTTPINRTVRKQYTTRRENQQ